MAAERWIEEKRNNPYHVMDIVKLYRFCLYPVSPINAYKYCERFKKDSMLRYSECKHLNCVNCCNHLLLIMKYIVSQSIVSEILSLNDDLGFNKIKKFVTPSTQKECRMACKEIYPMDEPLVVAPPKKDSELGLSQEDAAKSCMDILVNGGPKVSGIYWVQPNVEQEAFSIWCD